MVTIPKPTIGGVGQASAPNINFARNATAESFGGAQARQLGQRGAALEQVGTTLYNENVRLERNKVTDELNTAMEEMRNVANNEFSKTGKDATEVAQNMQNKLEDLRTQYGGTAKTKEARQLFNANYDSMTNKYMNSAIAFQSKARAQYNVDVKNANSFEQLQRAKVTPNDQEVIDDVYASIEANTRSIAAGVDTVTNEQRPVAAPGEDEVIDAEVKRNIHGASADIVNSLIERKDYAGAKQFMEANEDRVDPVFAESTIRSLDTKIGEIGVFQSVEAVRAQHPGDTQKQLELMREAYKDKPEQMKLAVSEVKNRDREDQLFAKRAQDDSAEDYFRIVEADIAAGRNHVVDEEQPKYVRDAARSYIAQQQRAAAGGAKIVTDYALYDEYMTNPDALAKLSTEQYVKLRNSFTTEDWGRISKLRYTTIRGTRDLNLEWSRTRWQILSGKGKLVSTIAKSPDRVAYYDRVALEAARRQEQLGRELTEIEYTELANDFLIDEAYKAGVEPDKHDDIPTTAQWDDNRNYFFEYRDGILFTWSPSTGKQSRYARREEAGIDSVDLGRGDLPTASIGVNR